MASFCVEVVAYENDEVVKRLPGLTEAKADRVDDGININLNHDEYFTRIVEPKEE